MLSRYYHPRLKKKTPGDKAKIILKCRAVKPQNVNDQRYQHDEPIF